MLSLVHVVTHGRIVIFDVFGKLALFFVIAVLAKMGQRNRPLRSCHASKHDLCTVFKTPAKGTDLIVPFAHAIGRVAGLFQVFPHHRQIVWNVSACFDEMVQVLSR